MDDISNKKIKIDLTKTPYQTDVALRSALPFLDKTGVLLLEELLFSSLETTLEEISDNTDLSLPVIEEALLQLSPLALFIKNGSKVTVHKDRRRLLQTEVHRFEEGFHPDLNYLKSRLSLLPPSVLLDWYVVPRTCHDIFGSFIEKHLYHPRLFQRYIDEIQFDDPRLQTIVKALYLSDEHLLSFQDMQIGFGISREELHTMMLQLEYHFIAFIKYLPTEAGEWEEVIVPLKEWVDYQEWVDKGTEPAIYQVEPAQKVPKVERMPDFKERQVKGVERRLRSIKRGAWVPLEKFIHHLDVPMKEPHELMLETRGKRWSYTLPVHSTEEKAAFRSLLFERFAKTGVVLLGEREGEWYFTLTSKGHEFLT